MSLELINNRYSLRTFSDKPVEDEKLSNVLEAARLAPSWINVQPWHFIAVKNKATKDLLGELAHFQPHVPKAPVIIVCCGNAGAWDQENYRKTIESRPGITKEKLEWLLSNQALNPGLIGQSIVELRTVEQLTYAISYMTIEAVDQGLNTCIIGGIGNDFTKSIPDVYEKVKKELNLPDSMFISNLLLLGYPEVGIDKPEKSRKQPQEVISYEKFGSGADSYSS